MGIISRFKDIMAANINQLLDKAEDPEKMIDQYLRNLQKDLGSVKAETASVMADAQRAQRELNEAKEEVAKLQNYAERAVTAGNDADAKTFLQKKAALQNKVAELEKMNQMAQDSATKMRQMHDKLVGDIAALEAKRDLIKSKVKVAKTQKRLNEVGGSVKGAMSNMSAFDRMEAKADKMLDEANAMAELNSTSQEQDLDDLMSKYDNQPIDTTVDDELALLKAKLGK